MSELVSVYIVSAARTPIGELMQEAEEEQSTASFLPIAHITSGIPCCVVLCLNEDLNNVHIT